VPEREFGNSLRVFGLLCAGLGNLRWWPPPTWPLPGTAERRSRQKRDCCACGRRLRNSNGGENFERSGSCAAEVGSAAKSGRICPIHRHAVRRPAGRKRGFEASIDLRSRRLCSLWVPLIKPAFIDPRSTQSGKVMQGLDAGQEKVRSASDGHETTEALAS
jgi:hypothetical protein